jgi:PAS domain S-box-containing protein
MATSLDYLEDRSDLELSESDKFRCLLNTLKGHEEFVLDRFGIIICSNLEAVTITGYEEWEVIGKHISLFYAEEDQLAQKPEEDLDKTTRLGKYISSGFRVKKRGDRFWAKMKFESLIKEEGAMAGYRVILSDSTHRVMYSMSTRRIKDEYLNLFNSSFVGIFKFRTKDYSCMLINDKALAMLGCTNEFKPKLNEIFLDRAEFDSFNKQLREKRRVENFEFQFNAPSHEKYFSISCKLFSNGGFIEGMITDVSERRRHLKELEHLKAELDNFLYRASHDIRSPIATILGLLNLVKMEGSVSNIFEYTDKITERIKHLDDLLANLSLVALNNTQDLIPQLIKPNELINGILNSYRQNYPFIKFSVLHNQKNPFYTDLVRVIPILSNIISNACKYYCSNKKDPFVKIEFACNVKEARIRIEDNGKGIKPEYQQDIFKQFFRLDSQGTGSGLGLYVVQSMIEKLGGAVNITSTQGVGTCVTIVIPNMNNQYYLVQAELNKRESGNA